MRSRILSKLIFRLRKLRGILRSRVLRVLRGSISDQIWQHPTKSDSCRTQGGYTCTVYSLKVLQEVSRDPAQAWCLGSCGLLDAHAVDAARTCTMMGTSALLNIRRSYIPPKGVHTCVAAERWPGLSDSVLLHQGDERCTWCYSSLDLLFKTLPGGIRKQKPWSKRLDPERIREIEARDQHNDHRVHHAHPHPPGPNPASPAAAAYVRCNDIPHSPVLKSDAGVGLLYDIRIRYSNTSRLLFLLVVSLLCAFIYLVLMKIKKK